MSSPVYVGGGEVLSHTHTHTHTHTHAHRHTHTHRHTHREHGEEHVVVVDEEDELVLSVGELSGHAEDEVLHLCLQGQEAAVHLWGVCV